MKVLGIIAEFNPFHNGHKYLIDKAKKITGADIVIIVMSGNFTEQGNIAIYNKFDRAHMAIANGADIVIELPCIFAISSAELFCLKAVEILNSLNIVDFIAFGTESNIEILNKVSDKLLKNEEKIWESTTANLKKGISFAAARNDSLKEILTPEELNASSQSNNILALNYLSTLKKLNSNIKPLAIKRVGNLYNDTKLSDLSFSSATAIRHSLEQRENLNNIKEQIPDNVFEYISKNTPAQNEDMFLLLKYQILELGKDNLKYINEVTEGLENRIYDSIGISKNYQDFINNIKSKRYQMSKIKRILLNILLDITKEKFNNIKEKELYAHILALSTSGKKYLPNLVTSSTIPVIIKKSDFDRINNSGVNDCLNYDLKASNIYSIITKDTINKDFLNKI